jgi:hypothetical protein
VGFLVALAAPASTAEAGNLLPLYIWTPTVTGGSFVDPTEVMDGMNRLSIAPDHMSFSVTGDFSVVASSSTVTVSIYAAVLNALNSDVQNTFNVNTTIDGTFAYIPVGSESPPTLTTFASTSDLMGFPPTATVSLPPSPVTLSTAPNFPTGGLELNGSANTVVTLPPGLSYRGFLEQTTTITFNNVTSGQTLQISFPLNTSLSSVPEPGSCALLALGGVLTAAGAVWRRKHTHAIRVGQGPKP